MYGLTQPVIERRSFALELSTIIFTPLVKHDNLYTTG